MLRPSALDNQNRPQNADPPEQGEQRQTNAAGQDLHALIEMLVRQTIETHGREMLNSTLNPQANTFQAVDQVILEEHRHNIADLDKVPDVVRCLREFSGDPREFSSWKKGVDRILNIYNQLIGTPKYYGIISVIRNKIIGQADVVLESYNTPLNWPAISKCLTLHYADKRDIGTLEYQMTSLVQGNKTIQQFYHDVYSHLSLILNKIACMDLGNESLMVLTTSHREKALDTFIRGLRGELPKLLAMREPADLPQALHLCLKLENQNFRTSYANNRYSQAPPLPPKRYEHNRSNQRQNNQNYNQRNYQRDFHPELAHLPQTRWTNAMQNNQQYNNAQKFQNLPPPRPNSSKPQPKPEPMEVDGTIQTRNIDYMNRPPQQNYGRRPLSTTNFKQGKRQRNYHIREEKQRNSNEKAIFKIFPNNNAHSCVANDQPLPFFEYKINKKDRIHILIDTGSSSNYIKQDLISNPIKNYNNFKVSSVAGDVIITHHTFICMFGKKLKFYLMPTLKGFHGILGNGSLTKLSAVIHVGRKKMIVNNEEVDIKQQPLCSNDEVPESDEKQVVDSYNEEIVESYEEQESESNEKVVGTSEEQSIGINDEHLNAEYKTKMHMILQANKELFANPNEKLTYATEVVGRIRTTSDLPVYSRSYPYPMSLRGEVDKQVKELLDNDIIRPSRSPYNSPVWVVPKKANAMGQPQHRMVIDFRKLNEVTTADKYPIPEASEIISNLGKSVVFTTLDLKSGFHQIRLAEEDIEKTVFSVYNGKFEFKRLPFGLKNAPSIFQRALEDILREFIGECCYVYIDDIIIFSQTSAQHLKDIESIFETLRNANIKVQLEKCQFFKGQVEFLGFVISPEGITTSETKISAIANYPCPKTIKDIRAFLGLSGYYRKFVYNYASIAKPLTLLLRGEDGHISKHMSAKKQVTLNSEAHEAFKKIKNALISREVLLAYPDYSKPFDLTTDASNYAIGAVLSQLGKPIAFISRTLSKTEENYATNEKEMLAIIWALSHFRNYLYGTAEVHIFTDHQPLTYALSNKNNNGKLKRWKSILEEYNYKLFYKPGKENVVADALSRPPVCPCHPNLNTLTMTQHSAESSSHALAPHVEAPINAFKNQIILEMGNACSYKFKIIFPTYHRHVLQEPKYTLDNLISILKRYLNPSEINCIKTPENIIGKIQELIPIHFRSYKIRFSNKIVQDVAKESEQNEIIVQTHNRAHRNARENKKQILERYYLSAMARKIKDVTKNCSICKKNKYDRNPNVAMLGETPIPDFPGDILHIDIFIIGKQLALTALDKFSKLAQARIIKGKSIEDIRLTLRELLYYFGVPKSVVIDNERTLNSESILFMMKEDLGINVFTTPPYRSQVNGQVERFHSTLVEIMRYLKDNKKQMNFEQLLQKAIVEYNHSYHSVINEKPINVFFGRNIECTPEAYERARQNNIERLKEKQMRDLQVHNKNRVEPKQYAPGQKIFVKQNERLGTKLDERYKEFEVKENNHTTVTTT